MESREFHFEVEKSSNLVKTELQKRPTFGVRHCCVRNNPLPTSTTRPRKSRGFSHPAILLRLGIAPVITSRGDSQGITPPTDETNGAQGGHGKGNLGHEGGPKQCGRFVETAGQSSSPPWPPECSQETGRLQLEPRTMYMPNRNLPAKTRLEESPTCEPDN